MLNTVARLTVLATILAPGLALAHAEQDFQPVNRTGYQIDEVHEGPVSGSEWGDDVMGEDAVGEGESAEITFQGGGCKWDVRVVYDDGDASEFHQVNLCNISTVTVFRNRKAGSTRFVPELLRGKPGAASPCALGRGTLTGSKSSISCRGSS